MNNRISSAFLIVLLLLFGALGALYYIKAEWTPPKVTMTPEHLKASAKTVFTITAVEEHSSLRRVRILAEQGSSIYEVLNQELPEGMKELQQDFTLPSNIKNGPLTLTLTVTDTSWHRLGRGNRVQIVRELDIDTKPPVVAILSGQHNVNQGGTGFLVYSTDKELAQTGIRLGDYFFPGYPYRAGHYLCFFGLPYNVEPKNVTPLLFAQDLAGNEVSVSFHFKGLAKKFKHDNINVSDTFLQSKMGQFADLYPEANKSIDIFIKVNSELRAKNLTTLLELGRDTVPQMLWADTFVRLPNSAPMAGFADNRTYLYNGQVVDNQTHLGVDLASLATAPIPAGNTGRVIFADFLGIYGNMVLLDHGFGLQSLYSHMSEIHVQKGETVQRGQIIGKTGATGMAGGDHLHFGILISGLEVQPIEWWDINWIKNNITSKLE